MEEDVEKKRLYIGGLSHEVTEDDLRQKFRHFGDVNSVNVVTKNVGDETRTFAFLELTLTKSNLANCLKTLSFTKWKGKEMIVQQANESFLTRLQREREANKCVADERAQQSCGPAIQHSRALPPSAVHFRGQHRRFDADDDDDRGEDDSHTAKEFGSSSKPLSRSNHATVNRGFSGTFDERPSSGRLSHSYDRSEERSYPQNRFNGRASKTLYHRHAEPDVDDCDVDTFTEEASWRKDDFAMKQFLSRKKKSGDGEGGLSFEIVKSDYKAPVDVPKMSKKKATKLSKETERCVEDEHDNSSRKTDEKEFSLSRKFDRIVESMTQGDSPHESENSRTVKGFEKKNTNLNGGFKKQNADESNSSVNAAAVVSAKKRHENETNLLPAPYDTLTHPTVKLRSVRDSARTFFFLDHDERLESAIKYFSACTDAQKPATTWNEKRNEIHELCKTLRQRAKKRQGSLPLAKKPTKFKRRHLKRKGLHRRQKYPKQKMPSHNRKESSKQKPHKS